MLVCRVRVVAEQILYHVMQMKAAQTVDEYVSLCPKPVQLPSDKPLPITLIKSMVRFRVQSLQAT